MILLHLRTLKSNHFLAFVDCKSATIFRTISLNSVISADILVFHLFSHMTLFFRWGNIEFPMPFGRVLSATERFIHGLDEKVYISLYKMFQSLLNLLRDFNFKREEDVLLLNYVET